MSVLLNGPVPGRSDVGPQRYRSALPAGAAVLALGLALLIWQSRFRVAEATLSSWVLGVARFPGAGSAGHTIIFPLRGQWVGLSLTAGCTAALLMAPFFIIGALLFASRRIRPRRILTALALVTAIVFVVNQLRVFVIAGSMDLWGIRAGFERSHILLGTVLSTTGVLVGIVIFVWTLIPSPDRPIASQPADTRA